MPRAKPLGFYNLLGKYVLFCSFTHTANYMIHIMILSSCVPSASPLHISLVALAAWQFYLNNAPFISSCFSPALYHPPQTYCYIPNGFPYCVIFTQPCSIQLPVKPVSFINIFWLLSISSSRQFPYMRGDGLLTWLYYYL